jgi:hypothetical protein
LKLSFFLWEEKMSTEYYPTTSYIGGSAGALDAIPCATLGTGDIAVVAYSGVFSVHYYDGTSAAAESSPDVIKPDDNAGNGRWLLVFELDGPVFSGQATIPTINLTGGQIIFPATAVPSANVNTLDDYEEGTFTPTILLGGTPVTSYYYQNGYYTKIGDRVLFNLYVTVNVIGAGTGAVTVGGLPFTSSSKTRAYSTISLQADYLTGMTGQNLSGMIAPTTSSVLLYYLNNTRATVLPHTVMDAADTNFVIAGMYHV